MSKPQVLVLTTESSEHADHIPEYKEFLTFFDVIVYQVTTRAELISKFSHEFKNIEAIWTTGHSIYSIGGVTELAPHFPESVKVYCFSWVGYLEEERQVLKNRGIKFCNVGDVSAHDVADCALYLTLSCFKFGNFFEHQFRPALSIMPAREILGSRAFDSEGEPLPPPANGVNLAHSSSIGGKKVESPTGKVAGIVGLGSIGKEIGYRLNAIGMKISYTKRSPLSAADEAQLGYTAKFYSSFKELIQEVDLIVIAVPHSPETENLINRETLKLAKRGVRIVNIGRGTAIDEEALLDALDDGTVCSVGLDVFRNEPNGVDPRFAKRWDVTMTPHFGSLTTDNIVDSNKRCMANIKNILLEGGEGVTPIL
jgi:lactate dehydrogenase-like 2-hydroxyacid dehydrogenase